ncbi:hypothetical protein ACLKA7_008177 [Drosophila subpalustris]
MDEFNKLVAQYQCKSSVDVSSSDSDSDSDNITSGVVVLTKATKETKDANSESGKRKAGPVRLPTRRPDPNVYNRNALLARENRRKKKAHMEALEKELDETRNKNRSLLKALKKQFKLSQKLEKECLNTDVLSADKRAVSPDGSLISTYSGSSYEPPMDTDSLTGLLNVDNDYQPTPEYENENSTRFPEQTSFGLQECQSTLNPLEIIDEHSYFNKFAQIGVSPNWEWSASCTPPTQLLQDDEFLDIEDGEHIASVEARWILYVSSTQMVLIDQISSCGQQLRRN